MEPSPDETPMEEGHKARNCLATFMRYRLQTLLIALAVVQVTASIVAAGFRVTPMAAVGCYAVLLLLAASFLARSGAPVKWLYSMISILVAGLAAAAVAVQLTMNR